MSVPCILISNELNLHREVFEGVLHAQRPHLPIHAVAPSELTSKPGCQNPRLLICNDQSIVNSMHPFAWILLYPGGENLAHVGIGDTRRTLFDASMQELVNVIDEVWSLPYVSHE